LLSFIAVLVLCVPLFMHSCAGGILPYMVEGVEEAGEEIPVASFKLVRLDGTELDLDARPIPCAVKIKATFDRALDEGERAAVESGFILMEGETSLAVSFEWTDDQTAIITPASWFDYGKTYSVGLNSEVASFSAQMAKAAEFLELSFTIVSRGDMNGDGDVDIIIGAPFADIGVTNRGRAYILAVGGDCNLSADCRPEATISGAAAQDYLGVSVSMADVNADGYADVIVGANAWKLLWNPGKRGWVYIFHGSEAGIGDCDLSLAPSDPNACTPDATITGAGDIDNLGRSVSYAGDVNGDGYDDIIVGAPLYYVDAVAVVGQAYVFLGSEGGIGDCDLSISPSDPGACVPHATITGAAERARLGTAVSWAGDVNGDGYDDVIIGTDSTEDAVDDYRQSYVFYGSADGISDCNLFVDPSCAPATIIGAPSDRSLVGMAVSGAGDVNGDGYDDIIAGVDYYEDLLIGIVGQAYVFHGSENGILGGDAECYIDGDPVCTPEATITGKEVYESVGFAVSSAGDVNGDGYHDIIVGAPGLEVTFDEGGAYIFYGSPDGIALESQCTITGADKYGGLGTSVSGVGDLNGDGFDDIIVGAPASATGGRAYVFHGSAGGIGNCDLATPDACEPHITFTGGVEDEGFGIVR
jgi:hypothetical protein